MDKPRPEGIDLRPSLGVEALEARLSDGYDRIDAAQAAGLDVAAWEAFWLDLLRQYEAACDAVELASAA
jgi:hypothetical protein